MDKLIEKGNVIVSGHIIIRDTETGKILLNKSESSLIDKKGKDDNEG